MHGRFRRRQAAMVVPEPMKGSSTTGGCSLLHQVGEERYRLLCRVEVVGAARVILFPFPHAAAPEVGEILRGSRRREPDPFTGGKVSGPSPGRFIPAAPRPALQTVIPVLIRPKQDDLRKGKPGRGVKGVIHPDKVAVPLGGTPARFGVIVGGRVGRV